MSTPLDDVRENNQGSPSPVVRPLWRNQDFLLLWGGQSISSLGSGISALALPLLILTLTRSPVQAGFVSGLGALSYLLLSLVAGALLDRWDRKRVMIVCNVLLGLNMASIPLALVAGHLTIIQIYVNSLLANACTIFLYVAEKASLPRVVPKKQLPSATAQYEATESIITLLSPSLGGFLYGIAQALPFLADAVSYAVYTLLLISIKTRFQLEDGRVQQNIVAEIREGFTWLWHQPLMRSMTMLSIGYFFVFGLSGQLPVIVRAQSLHATAATVGLIFAAGGAGGLLGALVAPLLQRRYRTGHLLICVYWGFALLWPLYAIAPNALMLGVVEASTAFVDQIADVVWVSHRTALIPDALLGRVTSTYRLAVLSLRPLGMALSGIVIQRVGATQTFLIAALCLIVLTALMTAHKHIRNAGPTG